MLDKLKRFNWLMFAAMLALVALGTAAIYSAGNAREAAVFHSMWKANLSTAAFGLVVYFVLAFFDYRRYLNLLAAPYIHASAAITQSFATSLGWKNQSQRRPP